MRRFIFLVILIGSLFIIQSLVRSIYALWQKHDLLVRSETELKHQKKENEELKHKLDAVQSLTFIEQEARNKLFLQKPGESRVLVDERLMQAVASQAAEKKEHRSNWQAWWELFF